MEFNPLFFQKGSELGGEQILGKPQGFKSAGYLFSDLMKVYLNETTDGLLENDQQNLLGKDFLNVEESEQTALGVISGVALSSDNFNTIVKEIQNLFSNSENLSFDELTQQLSSLLGEEATSDLKNVNQLLNTIKNELETKGSLVLAYPSPSGVSLISISKEQPIEGGENGGVESSAFSVSVAEVDENALPGLTGLFSEDAVERLTAARKNENGSILLLGFQNVDSAETETVSVTNANPQNQTQSAKSVNENGLPANNTTAATNLTELPVFTDEPDLSATQSLGKDASQVQDLKALQSKFSNELVSVKAAVKENSNSSAQTLSSVNESADMLSAVRKAAGKGLQSNPVSANEVEVSGSKQTADLKATVNGTQAEKPTTETITAQAAQSDISEETPNVLGGIPKGKPTNIESQFVRTTLNAAAQTAEKSVGQTVQSSNQTASSQQAVNLEQTQAAEQGESVKQTVKSEVSATSEQNSISGKAGTENKLASQLQNAQTSESMSVHDEVSIKENAKSNPTVETASKEKNSVNQQTTDASVKSYGAQKPETISKENTGSADRIQNQTGATEESAKKQSGVLKEKATTVENAPASSEQITRKENSSGKSEAVNHSVPTAEKSDKQTTSNELNKNNATRKRETVELNGANNDSRKQNQNATVTENKNEGISRPNTSSSNVQTEAKNVNAQSINTETQSKVKVTTEQTHVSESNGAQRNEASADVKKSSVETGAAHEITNKNSNQVSQAKDSNQPKDLKPNFAAGREEIKQTEEAKTSAPASNKDSNVRDVAAANDSNKKAETQPTDVRKNSVEENTLNFASKEVSDKKGKTVEFAPKNENANNNNSSNAAKADEKNAIASTGENGSQNSTSNSESDENAFKQNHETREREAKAVSSFNHKEFESIEAPKLRETVARTVKLSEVIKELSTLIQKKERSQITLQLNPESLGKVKVVIEVVDDIVKAHIKVENQAVQHTLQNNLPELSAHLERAGLQFGGVNISLYDPQEKESKQSYSKRKHNSNNAKDEAPEEGKGDTVRSLGYNTYEYLA